MGQWRRTGVGIAPGIPETSSERWVLDLQRSPEDWRPFGSGRQSGLPVFWIPPARGGARSWRPAVVVGASPASGERSEARRWSVTRVIPETEHALLVAEADVNHYGYVEQNPTTFGDPLGLLRMRSPRGEEWIRVPRPRSPPQRKGCDCVNRVFENLWTLDCCECHDSCYFQSGCGSGSWGHTLLTIVIPLVPDRPCDTCNKWAVSCFAGTPPPGVRAVTRPRCPWPMTRDIHGEPPARWTRGVEL